MFDLFSDPNDYPAERIYIGNINEKDTLLGTTFRLSSTMTVGIIILLSILMIIGVFIVSVSYYLFFKVAHKALKPIKLLNSWMRMLMTFKNSEFSQD